MSLFRDTISQSKEQREAGLIDLRVQEATVEMSHALVTAQRQRSAAQARLTAAITVPFDPARYVQAARDVAQAEQDIVDLRAAAQELGLTPVVAPSA